MDPVQIKNAEALYEQIKALVGEGKEFEICLRDGKKKFKMFKKFILNGMPDDKNKEVVEKLVKEIGKVIEVSNSNTDKLMKAVALTSKLQELCFLINVANLCVSAAGFAIMYAKLDKMSKQINEVLNTMKKIHGIQLNYEFDKILSEYRDMLDHKKIKQPYSEESYRKLIDKEYTVLKLLYSAFMEDSIGNTNELLYAITSLVNMMSATICDFDKIYYFAHRDVTSIDERWHTSHDTWMSIYKSINSKQFIEKLQDYLFLDEGLSQYQTDLFIASLQDSIKESKDKIKDQQALIMYVDSLQKYEEAQNMINQYLINQINMNAQKLSKSLSAKEQEVLETNIQNAERKVGIYATMM